VAGRPAAVLGTHDRIGSGHCRAAVLVPLAVLGAPAHPAPGPASPWTASTRQRPPSPGPASYLSTNGLTVVFVQWQPGPGDVISGTLTLDSPVGTAPDERVSSRRWSFTGTLSDGNVTLTRASTTVHGTVSSGTLTLQLASNDGRQLRTLTSADLAQYNAAVAAVRTRIGDDNAVARAAQREQARALASAKPSP
jgi:hypothetical protein